MSAASEQTRTTAVSASLLFAVIAAFVVLKSARDALFLGVFPVATLPYLLVANALTSAAVAAAYVRLTASSSAGRNIRASLAVFFGCVLLFWLGLHGESRRGILLFYLWVGLFGTLVPVQAWLAASERLSPRQARRTLGFLGAGASLGGSAGGILARACSKAWGATAGTGIAWRTHGRRATFAFALVILLAGLGYVMLRPARSKAGIPRLTNPLQATTALGVEDFPTWAPDGSTLAYAANVSGERGGNWDIWVAQVGGGAPVNRTADFPGNDMFPSWSPDGRQIAFWSEREGGAVFVMPAVGGTPRRVIASGQLFATQPAWSPDGATLAHPARDAKGELAELVTLRTGESRRVRLAGRAGNQRLDLKWSPDGRFLAYVDARTYQAQVTQVWVLRLADEKTMAVSDARMNDWSPIWSPDGRVLYFVSNRGGSRDLWEQRVGEDGTPTGDPERVTTGIDMRHAAFSPDGNKLAYSKGRQVANLWRVPIVSQRPATWAEAQQLTFDQAFIEFADVSRDGARLLVSSDRSGNPDLWTLPAGGGEMQQLTNDPTPDWDGRWSPDGREVAFYAYRSGNREIWVMPSSGGSARQVTRGETESVFPAWSPDGREIAFDSPRGGNRDVWVVPVTGGQPRRVTDDPAVDQFPSWSPDGKWLAFVSNRSGEPRLWRVPAAGGRAEPLAKGLGSIPKWSPGGKKVYFLATREGRPNIWAISVEDGREYPVTDLSGRRGNPGIYVLTTDDRYLYFSWEENFGDLWVMDAVSQRQ